MDLSPSTDTPATKGAFDTLSLTMKPTSIRPMRSLCSAHAHHLFDRKRPRRRADQVAGPIKPKEKPRRSGARLSTRSVSTLLNASLGEDVARNRWSIAPTGGETRGNAGYKKRPRRSGASQCFMRCHVLPYLTLPFPSKMARQCLLVPAAVRQSA